MITVQIFLLFLVYSNAQLENPKFIEEIQGIVLDCIDESNVDKALVEKLLKNKEHTDNNNFKCFIKCAYIKNGCMNEDGEINTDALNNIYTKFLGESKAANIMQNCAHLKGSDTCDTAFLIDKCAASI